MLLAAADACCAALFCSLLTGAGPAAPETSRPGHTPGAVHRPLHAEVKVPAGGGAKGRARYYPRERRRADGQAPLATIPGPDIAPRRLWASGAPPPPVLAPPGRRGWKRQGGPPASAAVGARGCDPVLPRVAPSGSFAKVDKPGPPHSTVAPQAVAASPMECGLLPEYLTQRPFYGGRRGSLHRASRITDTQRIEPASFVPQTGMSKGSMAT